MTTLGVYAGSFDPITRGHLSVLDQASLAFDSVVVAVGVNPAKQCLFDQDERQSLIREVTQGYPNVRVVSFQGLLADYCQSLKTESKSVVIVRGLRAVSDFESEMAIAHLNAQLAPEIPTVFFPTAAEHAYVSSSAARELAKVSSSSSARSALSQLVPPPVEAALFDRFHGEKDV